MSWETRATGPCNSCMPIGELPWLSEAAGWTWLCLNQRICFFYWFIGFFVVPLYRLVLILVVHLFMDMWAARSGYVYVSTFSFAFSPAELVLATKQEWDPGKVLQWYYVIMSVSNRFPKKEFNMALHGLKLLHFERSPPWVSWSGKWR